VRRSTEIGLTLPRMLADAARVRREVARVFDAEPADHVVLAPGILCALRYLLQAAGVERLVLTTDEYYGPRHFGNMTVRTAPATALAARVARTRADAVIASVVSWRGHPLPVSDLFGDIRARFGTRTPLLVADYTHAGALGFPPVRGLNADVVCGDPERWLLSPRHCSKLAFLWVRSPRLHRQARRAFAPFFLSMHAQDQDRSARWADPREVHEFAAWLERARLTRARLHGRHEANLRLKQKLAAALGIDGSDRAAVLWTDAKVPTRLRRSLDRAGLLWQADARHTRVICRADAFR
jgi:selenocysteine lyase/cysteine desulfurase